MARVRFVETLKLLAHNDVEFIVVGMTSAVLQGVPLTTFDLDILHRRTPENVERLLKVLSELQATYRNDPRKLQTTASHLLGPGHQLLNTMNGDLDCLGTIDNGKSFDDLLSSTVELRLSGDDTIRVLTLETLVELKKRAARPKDLAAIPHIESTIDERRNMARSTDKSSR